MSDALNDAVSSRAPRGAIHPGLSTYWIDRAEQSVRRAAEERSAEPFASGNVWFFRLEGDQVVAAYDFDPEANADTLTLDDVLTLLAEWRTAVISAGGVSGEAAAALSPERPRRPKGPGA